jgi:hypothetical protein
MADLAAQGDAKAVKAFFMTGKKITINYSMKCQRSDQSLPLAADAGPGVDR